jgi:hypothetical protein
VLSLAGLSRLVTVPHQPPSWWYRWFSWYDWYYGSDSDWHPYSVLAERYILGVWRLLGEFVDESANWFATNAYNILKAIIGSLPSWAGTIAHGLSSLLDRIGLGALVWASNALDAAQRLFNWLPNEIKYAGMAWSTLFDLIVARAEAWVVSNYDLARSRALYVYDWLTSYGRILVEWYNANAARLQQIVQNPSAFVLGILGPEWPLLVTFTRDALVWLYNFKATYAKEIGDLLADPGGWILQHASEEIERLW